MQTPVCISEIGSNAHDSTLYFVTTIFVLRKKDDKEVLVELEMEFHLVWELKCRMLIGVDMLTPYHMGLNCKHSVLNVISCEVMTKIHIKATQSPLQNRKVKVAKHVVVLPNAYWTIPISFKSFLHECEVNFLPSYNTSTAYLTNAESFLELVCFSSSDLSSDTD